MLAGGTEPLLLSSDMMELVSIVTAQHSFFPKCEAKYNFSHQQSMLFSSTFPPLTMHAVMRFITQFMSLHKMNYNIPLYALFRENMMR